MASSALRLFAKLFAVLALAAGGELVVTARTEPPPELVRVEKITRQGTPVVLLGDSSVQPERAGAQSSAALLEATLGVKVDAIAHPAYAMRVHEAFVNAIRARGGRPRVFVVTVNLRSFAAAWHERPQYSFSSTIFALEHPSLVGRAAHRGLHVLKAFETSVAEQHAFDARPVWDDGRRLGTMRDITDIRDVVVSSYVQALSPDHQGVAQLRALARSIRQTDAKALFYVTPVDHESCMELVGARFEERVRANIEILRAASEGEGAVLLDLSHLLPASLFAWRHERYPNEHVVEEGRRRIAEALAREAISRTWLP